MDTSLFSRLQATKVAAAHTVGTSLVPKSGASSNLRGAKAFAADGTANTTGTSASNTASAATAGSTITSNDFLTLLVSELKNQDPTQPTDPSQYISQLVGVNSLEQLISINSGITSLDSAVTPASTGTGSGTTGSVARAGQVIPAESAVPAGTVAASQLHRPAAGSHRL